MVESSNDILPKPPMISVWMTAFNHGEFIAQAIESVLMQRTNYNYEIVIGEDFSDDNTRQIVMAYQEKFPDIIKAYLPEANLGMMQMFLDSYQLCSGKYIAWLDGDDYWTDENKLQQQVDFLEQNPGFVMSFHAIKYLELESGRMYSSSQMPLIAADDSLGLEDFFKYNMATSLSVVHRNILGSKLPAWITNLPYPDLAFHFLLLQSGRAKYFRDEMGVYRIHAGGSWSGVSEYEKANSLALFYRKIRSYMDLGKNEVFIRNSFPLFIAILEKSIEWNKWRNAAFYFYYLNFHFPQFRRDEPQVFKNAVKYLGGLIPRRIRNLIKNK